jgi:hypothetical protein
VAFEIGDGFLQHSHRHGCHCEFHSGKTAHSADWTTNLSQFAFPTARKRSNDKVQPHRAFLQIIFKWQPLANLAAVDVVALGTKASKGKFFTVYSILGLFIYMNSNVANILKK